MPTISACPLPHLDRSRTRIGMSTAESNMAGYQLTLSCPSDESSEPVPMGIVSH
jgi:hypothetical protein